MQAYLRIFRTLCSLGIFRTVAYPQPWYIQNQKDIQNPDIFATLVYSEPRYIQQAGIFEIWGIFRTLSNIYNEALIVNGWMVNGCNYFCGISLSRSLLHEVNIMNFFNTGLIFTLEVVILCKKLWRARGPRTVNFRCTYWYIQINWSICS